MAKAKKPSAPAEAGGATYLTREPGVSVSIGRKINLGNYESADIFMSVNGLEPGASDAEIEEALATGDRAFVILKRHMLARLKEVRDGAVS